MKTLIWILRHPIYYLRWSQKYGFSDAFRVLTVIFCTSLLVLASCTTTKTESNGTTTTTTGIDQSAGTQAAIAAATQIATAAANAAIQTYLTTPHARLVERSPAIDAAKRATESEIRKAQPSLSPLRVHNIVSHAYAKTMHGSSE